MMKIPKDLVDKIIAESNLTAYRQGYNIKTRQTLAEPITNQLVIEHDPLLNNNVTVILARHNPVKGIYLYLIVKCKVCPLINYKIQLTVRIIFSDKTFCLIYKIKISKYLAKT